MNKIKIVIILLVFFSSLLIYSEDENHEPSWVYLKRAENYKEKGDYAHALIEARKSRDILIKEKLKEYYEKIREEHKDKIEYELITMTKDKEQDLLNNDNYPQYHELMGDLYVLTGLLEKAETEYKTAINQKKYFDYPQKMLEIKYKVADIHHKKREYELEDIIYREIIKDYLDKKPKEYWDRIRININKDTSLHHVFRLYRIEGTEYLPALYKIGRRSAVIKRNKEALFYLVNAAIVWMTHYSNLIQKYHFDFQYDSPTDFINYIAKKRIYEYESEEFVMDEILFYIGYVYLLDRYNLENRLTKIQAESKEYKQLIKELKLTTDINKHFFNLSVIFSKNTKREYEIKNRINYLKKYPDHELSFEEILY